MFNRKHFHYTETQDLFRLLKPLHGGNFAPQVYENWYRARHYALNILHVQTPYDGKLAQDGVHFVLRGASPIMLSVARQIALIAHYPTFQEENGKNRTVITILYKKEEIDDIISELSKEEYLCHLPRLCKYTILEGSKEGYLKINKEHEDSYLDIELELIGFNSSDYDAYSYREKDMVINEEDIPPYQEAFSLIDIRKAKRVNMVYHVGADIDNLPADDPNTAERYSKALHYFCYQQSPMETQKKWDELCGNHRDSAIDQINLRNMISNVLCADCFETRLKAVINKKEVGIDDDAEITTTEIDKLIRKKYFYILGQVKSNLAQLAKCEHYRWIAEKLIFGILPLSEKERFEDEHKFGDDRKNYRKSLKKKGIHIDLCSYRTLRRINPGDMKYDCFLMMAMPRILRESLQ